MSDNSHDQHEAHTGPVKTPKQMLLLSLASFVIPVFIIIGLVYYVVSDSKPAGSNQAERHALGGVTAQDMERGITQRLGKVGTVEIRDANRPLKAGEDVFKAQCAACHVSGAAGAPKLGDAGAWGARLKTGLESLVNSALKGKGVMGAQGGGDFEDIEIARAVVYLANKSGGKLTEPPAPAAKAEEGAAAPAK